MVTGDQIATARAIALAVGILPPTVPLNDGLVLTAREFDSRPDDSADPLPLVIARCTPESKVKLIKELHAQKGYVAMTGDGVNDAPALAQADVGVAMANASDVAKEAADMVLTEDDFGVIVTAIEEGRRIFANIRKFIILYLAGNVAEVIVLVFSICFGLAPPLLPIQVLWVNLISGTPPALALAAQPGHPDLMDARTRPAGEELWTTETLNDIFVYGTLQGTANLASFVLLRYVFHESLGHCQAAAFAGLTVLLSVHAYNCLDQRRSFVSTALFRVKQVLILHLTVWIAVGSLFITFYVPWSA
jgi:magnesium-transporting ATPase (P-type)